MDITTNLIEYNINLEKMSERFDIFSIKSTDFKKCLPKYFDGWTNAISVYYPYGPKLYFLFRKGEVNFDEVKNKINDPSIIVRQEIDFNEIKDKVLINLLVNSLNNFLNKKISFNNILGKLYVVDYKSKIKNGIYAMQVELMDDKLLNRKYIKVSTHSFKITKEKNNFKNKIFCFKNNCLKLATIDELQSADSLLFVEGSINNDKAKSNYINVDGNIDRATLALKIVEELISRYSDFLSINFIKASSDNSCKRLKLISKVDKMIEAIKYDQINIVNFCESDESIRGINISELIRYVKQTIKKYNHNISVSSHCLKNKLNIAIIHNTEYYKDKKDKYNEIKRDSPTQCLTIENLVETYLNTRKGFGDLIEVCLKELSIKKDIYKKHINTDDWEQRGFDKIYTLSTIKNDILVNMSIYPNGDLDYSFEKRNIMNYEKIEKMSDFLNNNKTECIISDNLGNINYIKKTDLIVLPDYSTLWNKIIRRVEFYNKYMCGVFDIHYFNLFNKFYYSVGGKHNINQNGIAKATHLYNVSIIAGENIVLELIDTLVVDFVRYKTYTVFPYIFKYLRELCCLDEKELFFLNNCKSGLL